jgi:drug/metabolite transporter (DMT)-like permease
LNPQVFYGVVALVASASWALGAVLWRKLDADLTPGGMNFAKVLLGSVLLMGLLPFSENAPTDVQSFLLLGVSGLLGIAIGDTFFFVSLVKLGPRRASLMGCLNPVCIALASFAALGERPAERVWAGIVIATLGVSWVLRERTPSNQEAADLRVGVVFGALSIFCTTTSVLLAKIGLVTMPSVQATVIRLLWALVGLLAFGAARGTLREWLAPFESRRLFLRVCLVVLVVVFGGFWLSLVALKHLDASIAGMLTSAAPILILPLVYFMLEERVSARAVGGALIAVGGIALILTARTATGN